jgi:hypothetical protein
MRFAVVGLAVVALAAAARDARADRHGFAFTLEYPTQPAAGVELEIQTTQDYERGDDASPETSLWQHRALVEYGVTDHFDLALAQELAQRDASGVFFTGTRLRARYRFAERGEWPVNVAAVVEGGKRFGVPAFDVEPRIVVARSFDSGLHVVANLIPAIHVADPPPDIDGNDPGGYAATFVPGWTLGVRVDVRATFSGGLETWGWLREVDGGWKPELWLGPAISWRPSTKLWFTAGGGGALVGRDRVADATVRFTIALSI